MHAAPPSGYKHEGDAGRRYRYWSGPDSVRMFPDSEYYHRSTVGRCQTVLWNVLRRGSPGKKGVILRLVAHHTALWCLPAKLQVFQFKALVDTGPAAYPPQDDWW